VVVTVTDFDGTPDPYAFVAVTVTVYFAPEVRPGISQVRAGWETIVPAVEQLKPPGLAVAA
jgi:hypothetical protein